MELKRKPLQGVANIIRFNWHLYLLAGLVLLSSALFSGLLPPPMQPLAMGLTVAAAVSMILSLVVSWYVYDLSGLYQLHWLPISGHHKILTINAGFDETSDLIKSKSPGVELTICDFYDPQKHTEVSIKRARKAYPPPSHTIRITTQQLPFADNSFDSSLAILSAHEIRDTQERIAFFQELRRVTKPSGQIVVTEHLRDLPNFIAYTVGFFHFHSRATWLSTFAHAGLQVRQHIKITPFISTFILEKNGDTL